MKTFEELKKVTNAIDSLMLEVGIKEFYITIDNGGEIVTIGRTYKDSNMAILYSKNFDNVEEQNL